MTGGAHACRQAGGQPVPPSVLQPSCREQVGHAISDILAKLNAEEESEQHAEHQHPAMVNLPWDQCHHRPQPRSQTRQLQQGGGRDPQGACSEGRLKLRVSVPHVGLYFSSCGPSGRDLGLLALDVLALSHQQVRLELHDLACRFLEMAFWGLSLRYGCSSCWRCKLSWGQACSST